MLASHCVTSDEWRAMKTEGIEGRERGEREGSWRRLESRGFGECAEKGRGLEKAREHGIWRECSVER